MTDLKPCPFCGSTELVEGQDVAQVFCYHCVAQGWRKDWNRRPIEDALRAEVARQLKECESLADASLRYARENADLHAEVAKLKAELERWTGTLTDDQLGSICAIIDEDQTPEMDTKINSLDTVIRVVREAGEKP